jgi:hypothetical protein
MHLAYYRKCDDSLTVYLENEAQAIKQLMQNTVHPSASDLGRTQQFLIKVELWKADCMQQRTGNAARNHPRKIWDFLQGAVTASNDRSALLSIMNLIGFGAAKDENTGQRQAKRATAVLRFLDPDECGTVDWRTIAILCFYRKNHFDMEMALEEAKKYDIRTIASSFDAVDENIALEIVQEYRSMRDQKLPRTVDVELALYGASFLA